MTGTATETVNSLSEEDLKLLEVLEQCVCSVERDENLLQVLSQLCEMIKTAASSMTSVPRPLKLLRPMFNRLEAAYNNLLTTNKAELAQLADVLSVLATTVPQTDRLILKYRLAGTKQNTVSWGHEYIRHLCGEIVAEFHDRSRDSKETDDIIDLVKEIVPFYMQHHSESDAIDILSEVDQLPFILECSIGAECTKVTDYLTCMASFAASSEEFNKMLKVVYDILIKNKLFPEAVRICLKLDNNELLQEAINLIPDKGVLIQVAFMLSRTRKNINFNSCTNVTSQGQQLNVEEVAELHRNLNSIKNGELFSKHYSVLATDLDVLEPKLPEDVYKLHLEEKRSSAGHSDVAKNSLVSTYVNCFLNCGFCSDKLLVGSEDSTWLYKHKDHGMMAVSASLGALHLWNIDEGINKIDRYQWSEDNNIKCGALMAFGLVGTGIQGECDSAFGLISSTLSCSHPVVKLGAILGLGFAYAGSFRQDILEILIPIIIDTSYTVECSAFAAVSLGLIFIGSANQDVAESILQTILERETIENGFSSPLTRFFAVGLGLLYYGCKDSCEVMLQAIQAIKHPIGRYFSVTVEGFAFAGTGDVLKIQKMVEICVEKRKDGENEYDYVDQSVAVLNIGLIALSETVGSEMVLRTLDHFLQYGDMHQRQSIPIALAVLHASNPVSSVVDTLSKLSHDGDADVALNAILGLGLVGAGTNNARIAGLLRQLASFYSRESSAIFLIRICQGLVYFGKGLLTLSPMYSDRLLINPVCLGSLLVVLHGLFNLQNTILGRQHYLLFFLVLAVRPRMVMTVDENLEVLKVPVRVGQALDTIGQAGKPRTVTGFQTHTTPVLLSYGERAELANDEYIPLTSIIDDVVVLRRNPDYQYQAIQ